MSQGLNEESDQIKGIKFAQLLSNIRQQIDESVVDGMTPAVQMPRIGFKSKAYLTAWLKVMADRRGQVGQIVPEKPKTPAVPVTDNPSNPTRNGMGQFRPQNF